jgi:hypothetical protein
MPFALNVSRICDVYPASLPASNVKTTARRLGSPREMTVAEPVGGSVAGGGAGVDVASGTGVVAVAAGSAVAVGASVAATVGLGVPVGDGVTSSSLHAARSSARRHASTSDRVVTYAFRTQDTGVGAG